LVPSVKEPPAVAIKTYFPPEYTILDFIRIQGVSDIIINSSAVKPPGIVPIPISTAALIHLRGYADLLELLEIPK
jgi:hypothetical protein